MSLAPSIRLEGMDALEKKLARIRDPKTRRKVMSRAMRKGARPIRDAARRKAPRRTSEPARKKGRPLHKTITIRSARRRRGHRETSVKVTTARGGQHAHLVEYGSHGKVRVAKRKSSQRAQRFGVMPAQPFMRPAFDEKKGEAFRITAIETEKGILEVLR